MVFVIECESGFAVEDPETRWVYTGWGPSGLGIMGLGLG